MPTIISGDGTITGLTATGISAVQNVGRTNLPAGSVLQVVQSTFSTQVTSSSSTFADVGLSATITPTSASNKILALMSINGVAKNSSDTYIVLQLVRNSTGIAIFDRGGSWNAGSASNGSGSSSGIYLDSPATTSATTYKVQLASGGNTGTVFCNVTLGGSTGQSTITLMEIAG